MSLEEVQAVNLTQSVLGTTESNALATDVVLLQDGAVGGQLGRNSSEPCPEFFLSLLTLSSHMDGSLPCTVGLSGGQGCLGLRLCPQPDIEQPPELTPFTSIDIH